MGLDQLVGLGNPQGVVLACEPAVEHNAGDLASLAGAGATAEKPDAAEADGIVGIFRSSRDDVECLIDGPHAGEIAGSLS